MSVSPAGVSVVLHGKNFDVRIMANFFEADSFMLALCIGNIDLISVDLTLPVGLEANRKQNLLGPFSHTVLFCSFLFYSRLCPSTAGSSPPPESSNFLCPLLSLSIPLPVAPQCHLSYNTLVFRLILHPLSATLCF